MYSSRSAVDVLLTLHREGIVTAERDDYNLSCRGNSRTVEGRIDAARLDRDRHRPWHIHRIVKELPGEGVLHHGQA
jgi:hypothetical protein